jgi:hypothetical protein
MKTFIVVFFALGAIMFLGFAGYAKSIASGFCFILLALLCMFACFYIELENESEDESIL